MDKVRFQDNEVAEKDDMNAITDLTQDYLKEFVQAFGNDALSFLFNNSPPSIASEVGQTLTYDIPTQRYCASGLIELIPDDGGGVHQESVVNSSPTVTMWHWIFFTIIETELTGTRTIVNPATGVGAATPGTVVQTQLSYQVESVETAVGAGMPSLPAWGGAGTRVGEVCYGYWVMDPTGGASSWQQLVANVLVLPGSVAIGDHAAAHVVSGGSNEIPLPTGTARGLMDINSGSYLAKMLTHVKPGTNEPFSTVMGGANNYPASPYHAVSSPGRYAELALTVGSGLSKAGGVLNHDWGTPGVDANKPARAIDVVAAAVPKFASGYINVSSAGSYNDINLVHNWGNNPATGQPYVPRMIYVHGVVEAPGGVLRYGWGVASSNDVGNHATEWANLVASQVCLGGSKANTSSTEGVPLTGKLVHNMLNGSVSYEGKLQGRYSNYVTLRIGSNRDFPLIWWMIA